MSADVSLQSPGRSGRSSDPNRALHTVAVTIASSRGSAALPSLVARRTAALARVDACAIYVTRPEGGVRSIARYVRAGAAEPTALRRLDRRGVYSAEDVRHCRRVMDTGQPAVLEAAEARDELVQGWARALTRGRPGHPTTFAVVPLPGRGRPLGFMLLGHRRPIVRGQLRSLQIVAAQLAMAVEEAQARTALTRRLHEARRLCHVWRTVGSTLRLGEVMRRITREAARAVGADTAAMYLPTGGGRELEPLVGYHVPPRLLGSMANVRMRPEEFARLGALLRGPARSVWSGDVSHDPRFDHPVFRTLGVQSVIIAPMRTAQSMGVLVCVWWKRRRRFSRAAVRLLETIAAQAAVAIANAVQYGRAEQAGVSRERARVAQELHDALNQVVLSSALTLDWCLRRSPAEDAELRGRLERVRLDTANIMDHMRDLIYRLGLEHPGADSLAARVQRLIDEVHAISPVRVEFRAHGDTVHLSQAHEEVLAKTFQEALANVIKHSGASRASVELSVLPSEVRFQVADDGDGLPPGVDLANLETLGHHFGLRHIRERLTTLGGQLRLARTSPRGLVLSGTVPIA